MEPAISEKELDIEVKIEQRKGHPLFKYLRKIYLEKTVSYLYRIFRMILDDFRIFRIGVDGYSIISAKK